MDTKKGQKKVYNFKGKRYQNVKAMYVEFHGETTPSRK